MSTTITILRRNHRETFVLSLPDFNFQNVIVDERGNLTGLIDWDNVQTVPRFLGHASFIAAYDDVRRLEIARKIVGRVSRADDDDDDDDDDDALGIIEDVGSGKLTLKGKDKLGASLSSAMNELFRGHPV